jgi:hypothetical protein
VFPESDAEALPEFAWYANKKILFCTFSNCSNDRLQHDVQFIEAAMSESSEPIIHFVADYSHVTRIPGILAWARIRFHSWDRVGWLVVYGLQNQSLQLLLSYVARLYSVKIHFCENLAQALDFLQHVDQTLPQVRAISEV